MAAKGGKNGKEISKIPLAMIKMIATVAGPSSRERF
jgi:hypothetical protein